MSTIEESIEVGVPVRAAYDQWTQFEEFPQFMGGVDEVRQLSDTDLHWRMTIAGKTKEWDAKVTQQEPDQVIAWAATGGYTNAGEVRFQPLGPDRTRIDLRLEHEPEGLIEKAGAALGVDDRKAKGNLERFKELIESRGGNPSGEWRGEVQGGQTASTGQGSGGGGAGTPLADDVITDPSPGVHSSEGIEGGSIPSTAGRQTGTTGYGSSGFTDQPATAEDMDDPMARPLEEDLTDGPTPETRRAMDEPNR